MEMCTCFGHEKKKTRNKLVAIICNRKHKNDYLHMELDIERNFATMCKEHTVHRMELTIGHNWRTVVKCTITGDKIGVE